MGLRLRDIGATLPPGFRFYPSDEELVCHYLCKKITNEQVLKGTLVEIDLHTCEPWQLPEVAKLNASEWYFFSFRDRKYATGFRTNRATISGYWKATGKDRTVIDPATKEIVGMRKTLVFYRNRAPNGIKTGWIMHEFRLETPHTPPKEDWVLCRVFHKSKSADENNTNDHQFMYETTETNHSTTTTTTTNNNNNATLMIRSSLAAASSSSPPNLPNDHHESCGYHHHHQQLPSLSSSSTPPHHHQHHHHHHQIHHQGSFLNLLQQEIRNQSSSSSNNNLVTNTANDQILCSSKGVETNIDDEYGGFLWDEMNFEEANLGENHMRISYDDGSVVFL